MKKTIIYAAVVSFLVSAAVLFAAYSMGWIGIEKTVTVERVVETPASNVLYTKNEEGEVIPLDFTSIAEKVKDAVVHISSVSTMEERRTYDPFEEYFDDPFYKFFFGPRNRKQPKRETPREYRRGTGSGVIISEDGYIITNNHVVKEADKIEITLLDKRKYVAEVIGVDPTTDIALLKIDEDDLPKLQFFDSDQTKVGEWVMAVGNPFNLNSTVTAGIVSAKGRSIQILNENYAVESFIQTDAAINPGNSGGALVNLRGELLGINTAIASPTGAYAGYGFAVPSNIVKKVIEDLMKYGVVQRGFLGVMIREMNADLAEEKDLEVTNGVLVDSLTQSSAAREAGIEKNDVILSVDGVKVNSVPKLQELIARKRPGDQVNIRVNRSGKELDYNVVLYNQKGNEEIVEASSLSSVEEYLGVELEDLDSETARKLDIVGGVRIAKLSKGKIKEATNVKPGFIITKVDDRIVRNKKQLLSYLKSKKGGVLIEGRYENYPGEYYFGLGME